MRAALLASTALLGSAVSAQGQSWTGIFSPDWFTAGNWSTNSVPANGEQPTADTTTPNAPVIDGATAPAAGSYPQVFIGDNATGALIIQNGGTLNADNAFIGNNAGSNGTVTLTGAASVWNSIGASNGTIVGFNGTGTFNVTGGTVNTVNTIVGFGAASNGSVTVDGGSSIWNQTGAAPLSALFVGYGGIGTFTLSNGAAANAVDTYVGHLAGSNGTVTVTGNSGTPFFIASSWVSDNIFVGNYGTGTFNVQNGGTAASNFDTVVGANTGGVGTITVDGPGSQWTAGQDMIIGGNAVSQPGGSGTVTVQNGGAVSVFRDTIISATSGGVGTATVTGAGSTWTNTGDVYIGGIGTGTFNVLSGGVVAAGGDTYLGFISGAVGTLNIDGVGSQWTSTGIFDVGGNQASDSAGTGVVNVTNGGTLDTTANAAFLGDSSDGTGNGTVNINGGTWNGSNVAIGERGTGILNITNGGVANFSGQVILGDCDCGNGTVTVSGAGSQFNATGGGFQNVVIGWDGVGVFNLLNGATATIAGETVVGQGFGSGTLNVASGANFTTGQLTIGSNFATGTVTVSGAGSVLTSNTNTVIGAGSPANNSLNILDGATGNLANIIVGFFGGVGTLKVDATSLVNGTGYSQSGASTFNVGISQTGSGKVAITGADINLDGALVVSAKTTQAKTYNVMTTDNGVVGTFSSVSVVGNANNLQVAYNVPCDVGLNCVQLSVDQFSVANVVPPGTGDNAAQVAAALDKAIASGFTIPDPFFSVFALSGSNLVSALNQLSGESTTGAAKSNTQLMNSFLSLLLNPFGGAPTGNPGAIGYAREFGPASAQMSPQAAAAYAAVTPNDRRLDPHGARWGIWGQAYGGYAKSDGATSASTHDTTARAYGLATGFDHRLASNVTIGFALAGAHTSWGLSEGLGGGRSDVFQMGAYGSRQFGAAYVSGALSYAVQAVTTDRTVTVAGSDQLRAKFTAQSVGGRIETGYRAETSYGGLTPYAAVQLQGFFTPSYTESAVSGSSAFALSLQSQSTLTSRTELGMWFDKTISLDKGDRLGLRGRLAWANDQSNNKGVDAVFQTLPVANFTVNGAQPSTNLALVTAGAEYRLASNVSVGGKFDSELGNRSQTYAGTATMRYSW